MPASAHLVHGMGMALEAPAWPVITASEAERLLSDFPAAGRLEQLNWHSPRPFSAASLLQTDRGAFVLKRHHHRLRTPAALAEEHDFIAHLQAAGLPVPEVIAAADGGTAIERGEWTYELHRRAPGIDLYRDRQSWTPFLSLDHARQAGAALGRLHRAARGFAAPERDLWPLVSSFTILPSRSPIEAADAYVAARPALAAFLADKPWRRELARLFESLGQGLSKQLAGQPPLWTHNDWHPSNILWSADGAASTIFDFGLAAPTCAAHDIATAIERTAIRWLDLPTDGDGQLADGAAALALLEGYGSVLPLGRAGLETVIRLLPLVHVEFALSEADYFAGILNDHGQATLAWQDYLIDHADWFLRPAGQDFLRYLERGAMV